MPRFENEGYNPEKRRNVDRTVPVDENYYAEGYRGKGAGINPVDLDFNSRELPTPQPDNRQRANGNKRKAKRKKQQRAKIIIAAVLVLVLVITATPLAVMARVNYNDKVKNQYVDNSALVSGSGVKNVLLLGVDARAGENADETRSDTMMLVSIDTRHNTIKLTSFLRDTWLYIPSLDYNQRLNAACSSAGYHGVVDAIEYNFNINIDGYAVVDFDMFEVLVDSLGGVEVDVSEAEANEVTNNPERYGWVTLESGKYKLTGEQALAYCRIRKIDTDFVRTERQRTVMMSILSGAKSNPTRLLGMAYKSAPYIETDLSKGEIMSLAAGAVACLSGDFQQEKVPFDGTWDYATIQGNSVISINIEKNKEMLIDYIYE